MGIVTNAALALQSMLSGETGLSWALAEGSSKIVDLAPTDIRVENISVDVAEKSPIRYPVVFIYCERLINTQREKFATVSGTLNLAIEIRASGNAVNTVSEQALVHAEAVMKVLDCHKGEWADGIQYCGGYDVSFQQIKRGGTQLIQVTKIAVPLQIHQR
jgi:hypothetical protein